MTGTNRDVDSVIRNSAITQATSVTNSASKTGIEVDRKNITLDAPLNKLGKFTMTIKLTSKVKAEVPVSVVASEIIKEEIISEEEATEE